MEKLPKIKDLDAPQGYFESLPDQILSKSKQNQSFGYLKYAAAAALVFSLGWWQYGNQSTSPQPLSLEEEALLYIESNQWTAEDVLSMSEDPNALLDQIIEEEITSLSPELMENEEDWF